MAYTAKNYEHLIGLSGFGENLLRTHFGLYEGYVKNVNALSEKIAAARVSAPEALFLPEQSELRRRFGWEWNGMRLHELYFEGISREKRERNVGSALWKEISSQFGSFEAWRDDLISCAKMRGIGWVLLVHDSESGVLANIWVNEHDCGHLAGTKPILVMDVFEHSYFLDYGANRAGYLDAFLGAVDWVVVEGRF